MKVNLHCMVLALAAASLPAAAQDAAPTYPAHNSLDSVLRPSGGAVVQPVQRDQISLVRESVLKDLAFVLGAQAGLADRSREIFSILDMRSKALDARFQFNRLVLGQNVLPPVISESRGVVALDAASMVVADVVYHIDEPARFALPTPTWRNWLYLGLDINPPEPKRIDAQVLPQNAQEQAYWERIVRQGYEAGRDQAQATYDANWHLLERTYGGMRRFYELVQRGMVTAPVIATASEILQRHDPNTVSVGNTVFRITANTDFSQPSGWIPLE
jgi:defect-in-organelle-trafficking protein DotC